MHSPNEENEQNKDKLAMDNDYYQFELSKPEPG